jgi:hypothetical protein
LGLLLLTTALFAWRSAQIAVTVADSSTWLVPMALFSIYLILISLSVVLFRNMLSLELMLLTSLSLSLVFAASVLQLIAVLLGSYLLFLFSRAVRRDMELNIKISPWKSLQSGKTYLLVAFCLLISMQYFITIRSFDGEKKVPHFDASIITRKIAIPFLSSVNPQFKALKDETLTVDQFILQTQDASQNNIFSSLDDETLDAQLPANLTPAQKELIKAQARENFSNTQSQVSQKNQELVLGIGRKQLSDTIGMPVDGSERISDVFTGLINNKINDYFNPKVAGGEKNSVFSMILAIVLFLIIYPVGLILLMLVFLLAQFVILALFKFNVLTIRTETVSKEVIE